ncbi:MAG TPA: aldehyde dehydrogenase family protein, partial [Bacillota bacterium]
ADVAATARAAAAARCQNSGQSCIAAKRFIVLDACFDAFADAFLAEMASLVVGDPLDEATRIGPLARADLRETLDRQVRESVRQGARLLLGGEVPAGPGYYYPPTVLVDVRPGMPAYAEELFGPVAVLFRAADEEDAVRLANDTSYGLGASVWTADPERGERVARRVEAGAVFVNGMVKSDPRLPFGGVKDSGYGRELSVHGLREFVNTRTVWVG